MPRKKKVVRGNIRRKGQRWEAYVRLYHGPGGLWARRFPLTMSREAMQAEIDQAVKDYREVAPQDGTPGMLSGDIDRYLALFAHRTAYQADRRRQLRWWLTQLGDVPRWTIKPVDIDAALSRRLADGYSASDVRHHRSGLHHLFVRLGGRNAKNPVQDVAPPPVPVALPRALPFALIERVFDMMTPTRYGRGLTAAQRDEARSSQLSPSNLARLWHVSEAAIRKARAAATPKGDDPALSRLRLRVMAYTGIPPAQLMKITAADVDWFGSSVLVVERAKGKGAGAVRLPLTPQGLQALRDLDAAKAWGRYSTAAARHTWRAAVNALCDSLEARVETHEAGQALRTQLARSTPYDLRHSYLTALQLAGKNIRATQAAAQHKDGRMTERYLLAAVDPELQAAVDALSASNLASNLSPVERDQKRQVPAGERQNTRRRSKGANR